MIAFPEPISALCNSGPCMLIALRGDYAIIVEGDGTIRDAALGELNIDWRYDRHAGVWLDIGPGGELGDEEAPDDGGEEVSGHLPDTDGAGGGDPGDREDGASRGVDPGEADEA